jgi:lipid-binding SYLF domain-containing protein
MRIFDVLSAVMLFGLLAGAHTGCSTSPRTPAQRSALAHESRATLTLMQERDPQLARFLSRSAGYAVFPNVGKGGLIVGGAFGRGTVYDSTGPLLGYATVTQGSVGGVIGARSYSLLLVFNTAQQLARFRDGQDVQFGAEATAIAITEGCSATTRYIDGVAVFALPRGGLMADASLNGQEFRFEQRDPDVKPKAKSGDSRDIASTDAW